MHTVDEVAPTVIEYVPAGQPVHETLPLSLLNLPATHAVQAPPSGPVYPMLHVQFEIVFADAENGDVVAVGHVKQIAGFALVIVTSPIVISVDVHLLSFFNALKNIYLPRITLVHDIVYGT